MNTVEAGDYRELLRSLLRARAFEALCGELPALPSYPPGDPRRISPALPAAFALRRSDDGRGDLFSLRHGSPAVALLFGLSAQDLFRQALGRATAPAQGRDPSGFPTDLTRGLLAAVPTPGALVEVLAGAALAFRLQDQPRVALVVDDARGSDSGFWHEGLNFAAVLRAPLVLVSDAVAPAGGRPGLRAKAAAYGVEAREAPADDPLALTVAVAEAVERARGGEGVQLVEATSRGSHVDDVIATLAGRLRWAEVVRDDEVEAWSTEAVHEMESALARALAEPAPHPDHAGASVHGSHIPTQEAR